jgi:hypothetical protein
MVRRLCSVVAVIGLCASSAFAQSTDARAALQAAARAMGTNDIKTIQVTAAGWSSDIGQTYGLAEDWPKFEVVNYVRTIDFEAKTSREEYDRRPGNYPLQGRNPRQEHVVQLLSGTYAWSLQGTTPVPFTRLYLDGAPYADVRQLEVALTPHGAIKAALAAGSAATAITLPIVGASDFGLSQFGRKVTIVSFPILGKYKMNLTINDQNLVELVDTWIPNPIYGDMDYEMRYTRYKDFGGVKFPLMLHVHHGDPRLNPAHNFYEYEVSDVKVNVPVPALPVPEVVKNATLAPVRVESQKLADGTWMLGGGTHNSLLVEFKDFLALVDAPNNEERSLAIIAEAEKLAPTKQIRYVVNTHHHMDHAGGLRTFLSQGSTIVTHESNKDYYMTIPFYPAPWTLKPDRMAIYNPMYMISRRPAPIETVGGETRGTAQYVVTDGVKMLQVFHVQDMSYELGDNAYRQGNHSQDMLMAFLPKEKILFNADLYSPPAPGAPPPAATPSVRTLYQNMLKWKLDVAQHAGAHGRTGSNDDFLKIVQNTARTN